MKDMKGQRGAALLLTLIALLLGSLLITPTIGYVTTGTIETRISKEQLLDQYSADAAVEYALWQLANNVDGITDLLDPDNPDSSTSITINGTEVPVITEISESPATDEGSFPVPATESGINLTTALEIIPPSWTAPGQEASFFHVLYMYNYGTSSIHMNGFTQQLDPRFVYAEGSYEGPSADLTKTYVDDHWELLFDFTEPLPVVGSEEYTVVTFVATAAAEDVAEGYTYSGSGTVSYAAFGSEELVSYAGEAGIASYGLYDITVTVGGYTILVNVGITEDGDLVLRSWQFI